MSNHVLFSIREALGLDPGDNRLDEEIMKMQPSRQFELYCQWQGLIGWDTRLKEVVFEIFKKEN